ncbi:MAG: TetR/AcrR family transcriptional regulator [Anaerolineales bacterium]|nr:TetR/AcrR family transcriptional regulator [Anaerolineales bacterium]
MSPRSKKLSAEMRAQSRAALVDAARKLFARQGYFNCPIAEVAAEAGMSPGNVYWHFASKEDLLKAVLADGFDSLGQVLAGAAAGPGSAVEKVNLLVEGVMQYARQRGDFNKIMLSLLGHGGDALFLQLGFAMPQIGLGYTRSVAAIVAQGQTEGSIPAGSDAIIPTMFFFGLFNGLNLTYDRQWLDLPPGDIHAAVRRLLGFVP